MLLFYFLFMQFHAIQELTGAASYSVSPSFIFEVEYHSAAGERFKTLSQDYDLMYAYHGSRWDNFHSITSNGLHAHMSKVRELTHQSVRCVPSLSLKYSSPC